MNPEAVLNDPLHLVETTWNEKTPPPALQRNESDEKTKDTMEESQINSPMPVYEDQK